MDLYAVYSYELKPPPVVEGDWTQSEKVEPTDTKTLKPRFDRLFGLRGAKVLIQRVADSEVKADHPCTVLAHDNGVVLLRIEKEKDNPYYDKDFGQSTPVPPIQKRFQKSYPYTYVIFDNRPSANPLRGQLLIKVDPDSWRNTDTVRNLLQESLDRWLEREKMDFSIEIRSMIQEKDFWDYSYERIKKNGRRVKKMTIYFTNGTVNSQELALIKNSPYLRHILKDPWSVSDGELTLNNPESGKLLDKRKHDIMNILALIRSNPNFGMSLTYDDDITYTCGQYSRAEYPGPGDGHLTNFELGTKDADMFKYELESWLDEIIEYTKDFKDAEPTKRKTNRKNRRDPAA